MNFSKKILIVSGILTIIIVGFLMRSNTKANQISNYSFESDTTGWGLDSDFTRTNTDSFEGSWSIKQVSTGGFANFTTANDATGITVTPNVDQIVTFYAKITITSGFSPLLDINTGSAFGTTIASRDFTATNGSWVRFTLSFNPSSNSKVWLRFHNNGGTITAFYDYFNLFTPAANPQITTYIKSIDVMKYTKDNICSQSSTSTIDSMLDKVVAANANYVSISGFYDNPGCGNDQTYMAKWVVEARSKGLKVWWRMKDLSWEGDYSVTKATSTNGSIHLTAMNNWLDANYSSTALTMQPGDLFTPFAEIQNGGIFGVNYCGGAGICQFTGADRDAATVAFNSFIRSVQSNAVARVPGGVSVGYYGFDGFIVGGLNNPDNQGHSFLESSTILQTLPVTIDDYPSSYGISATGIADNFQGHLAFFHTILQNVTGSSTLPIILGEYGTINATSTADQIYQINLETPMISADPLTVGFNYWNLGPVNDVTGEGLITNAFANKPGYALIQSFFGGIGITPTVEINNAKVQINNAKVQIVN